MKYEGRLDSITGLKGFFSILIVLFHTLPESPFISSIPLTSLIRLFGGTVGNYFFFVSSGFLISVGYRARIQRHELSLKEFALKRLSKIYPLYIITNAFALIITVLRNGLSAIHLDTIIFTILMQNGGGMGGSYPYNSSAWFINALFVCYLAFFFIAYHAKNPTQYTCMVAFGIIWGYSLISGYLSAPLAFAHQGDSFFCFFTGCALAELYPYIKESTHKWLQPVCAATLVFSFFLMLKFGVEVICGDLGAALALFIYPILIYLALYCKPVSAFLQIRPVQYLGKISFSIFLWHVVVCEYLCWGYMVISGNNALNGFRYPVYIAVMLVVSILSYHFIEPKKFLRISM